MFVAPGSQLNPIARKLGMVLLGALALALSAQAAPSKDLLHQLDNSVESLVKQVSPAVVQILVTGYASVEQHGHTDTALIAHQRTLGSGVIVDPEGYIITNAHVLQGAARVRVVLFSSENSNSPHATLRSKTTTMNARILGVHTDTDLALLKIEASGLPSLPFGRYQDVQQGQTVFAFGSPEGLSNSVTRGVVSSIARQPDPDRPFVYIQTDAPINPGNSGGPLVDIEGKVVGINSYILTEGGGNEGLGFAIPSGVVRRIYEQLRKQGHVHRQVIGASVQTITPTLAAGLGLQQDYGVIVSDVAPKGPADTAGLKVQDIILTLDKKPVINVPQFAAAYQWREDPAPLQLEVLRASEKISMEIPVAEVQDDMDRLADSLDPVKDLVPQLGIIGVQIDRRISAMVPDLRVASGVIVAARTAFGASVDSGLETGDVIHGLNGNTIISLEVLNAGIKDLKPGDPVVLQIERNSQLQYLAFEME
ncbi:MAG: trypsin-like peptidase domain-containing protein [Terriglobia bacterium]|jgi:serine protease Do